MTVITKASDMGAIKNHLGLLNANKSAFYPARLLDITGETPSTASRMLGVSRASLYKKEVSLRRNNDLVKKIVDFVSVGDLAFELLNQDKNETIIWLNSPNTDFFGDSPFEICLRGHGKKLIKWLLVRLGKEPGVAF